MTNDIKLFDNACNLLATLVNKKLFDGERRWWWVAEEIGGVCCFDDTDYLTPTEMKFILDNNITYEQYERWYDANLERLQDMDDALEALRPYLREGVSSRQARELVCAIRADYYKINLQSWTKGARHGKR